LAYANNIPAFFFVNNLGGGITVNQTIDELPDVQQTGAGHIAYLILEISIFFFFKSVVLEPLRKMNKRYTTNRNDPNPKKSIHPRKQLLFS